jgi:hypothetical protein
MLADGALLAPRPVSTAMPVDMAMERPNRNKQAFVLLSAQQGSIRWPVRGHAVIAPPVDMAAARQNQQKLASALLFAPRGSTRWQVRPPVVTARPAVIRQPRAATQIPAKPSAPPAAGPHPALHCAPNAPLVGGVLWAPLQRPVQEIVGREDLGRTTVSAATTTARDLVQLVDIAEQEQVFATSRAQQEGTGTARKAKLQLFAQEFVLQESSPRRGRQRVPRVELGTTRPSRAWNSAIHVSRSTNRRFSTRPKRRM